MSPLNISITLTIIALVIMMEMDDKDTDKGYIRRYLGRIGILLFLVISVSLFVFFP